MPYSDQIKSHSALTYSVTEIAELLGVSVRKAYNLCEKNEDFKALRLGKRCLRIHKESFDKWFNS